MVPPKRHRYCKMVLQLISFLVPGWRVGWIKIHDPMGLFRKEVRAGFIAVNQKTLGCNTIIQGALPKILTETPETFFIRTINSLERNAHMAYKILSEAKGLTPIMPQGAMYMMVRIDFENLPSFDTEIKFIEQMVKEESVFCLPGVCFNYPGYIRLVLTLPENLLTEACTRIIEFCNRHFIDQSNKTTQKLKQAAQIKLNSHFFYGKRITSKHENFKSVNCSENN